MQQHSSECRDKRTHTSTGTYTYINFCENEKAMIIIRIEDAYEKLRHFRSLPHSLFQVNASSAKLFLSVFDILQVVIIINFELN